MKEVNCYHPYGLPHRSLHLILQYPSDLGIKEVEIAPARKHDDIIMVEAVRNLISVDTGRQAVMGLKDDPNKSKAFLNLIGSVSCTLNHLHKTYMLPC